MTSRKERATELPVGEAKAAAVRQMFDAIAPKYDLMNRILTFGLDVRWRRKAVGALELPAGSLVADIACGTGDLCRDLERVGHRAVGIDFAFQMLTRSTVNASLVQADALSLPFRDEAFDGATCGFALRNVVDLDELFSELARVVRAGGRIALLDVGEPSWQPARAVHAVYFRKIVPAVGGWLSDRDAYAYLPRSTAYLPPPAQLCDDVAAPGFVDVTRRVLGAGAVQLITATKR